VTPPESYAAAVEELESILHRLDGAVDVDRLTAEVARAADLLAFCRERLAAATVDVQRIVASIEAPPDLRDERDGQDDRDGVSD